MVKIEENSELVMIEDVLRDPVKALAMYSKGVECSCILVDTPFIVTAEHAGTVIDVVVGVGSLICRSCGISDWRTVGPAWASGARLGKIECRFAGPTHVASLLTGLGLQVKGLELDEVLDSAKKSGSDAIAVLIGYEGLDVIAEPGFCGVIEATNPLFPAGVVGKQGFIGCIDRYTKLIGPRSRLLFPLIRVNRRPVMWLMRGFSDVLVVGFDPTRSSNYLTLAFVLGALYTCGERIE